VADLPHHLEAGARPAPDKIGLVGMMLISMTLMALAIVYIPSMVYGSAVALMYVAMVFMSAGISNALVTPPLVITQAMGLREFGKIFAVAVAFIYAGNAIGAPIWGVLGTSGNTKIGMYVAPVLLALFVIGCTIAIRRGKAQYRSRRRLSRLSQCPRSRPQGASELHPTRCPRFAKVRQVEADRVGIHPTAELNQTHPGSSPSADISSVQLHHR
jgi:MFS family permease